MKAGFTLVVFLGMVFKTLCSTAKAEVLWSVAYECADRERSGEVISLKFSARRELVRRCYRRYSPTLGKPCYWTRADVGSAGIYVLGHLDNVYDYIGLSPNPTLVDMEAYVFRRPIGYGREESLVVYVGLSHPEHSFYTIANENGLQERRSLICRVLHRR